MTYKHVGDVITYTNADGSNVQLEAVASTDLHGCVGQCCQGQCGGSVCYKLPAGCGDGFIWREAVS